MHEVFSDEEWLVRVWGDTDDVKAHEVVELIVEFIHSHGPAVVPTLHRLGEILVDAAIGVVLEEGIKKLIHRFRRQQEQKKSNYRIEAKGVHIHVAPVEDGTITVSLPDGRSLLIHY